MYIEMYLGAMDHTWRITTLEISDDTPADEIAPVAEEMLQAYLDAKDETVAFFGIYHIPELKSDEED